MQGHMGKHQGRQETGMREIHGQEPLLWFSWGGIGKTGNQAKQV